MTSPGFAAGACRPTWQAPAPGDAAVAEVTDLPEGFDFTFKSPLVNPDGVAGVAREIAGPARSLLEVLRATVDWVHHEIRYRRGATGVTTTAEQVLGTREGVCQDKTHLALGMLRALGIPCRYVSGLLTGRRVVPVPGCRDRVRGHRLSAVCRHRGRSR